MHPFSGLDSGVGIWSGDKISGIPVFYINMYIDNVLIYWWILLIWDSQDIWKILKNNIYSINILFLYVQLVALVGFRKLLDFIFDDREMCILDDPFPPWVALKKSSNENVVVVDGIDQALLRNYGLSSKETYIQWYFIDFVHLLIQCDSLCQELYDNTVNLNCFLYIKYLFVVQNIYIYISVHST